MTYYLSLVIPVYNGATFIGRSLSRILDWKKSFGKAVQVVLVNDGSTDETEQVIQSFLVSQPEFSADFLYITYPKNRGKGYAVKTGMMQAEGEYAIYTDADIPFGFKILEKFLYYLDFKEFDLVVGDRTLEGSLYKTEIPRSRQIGSDVFSFITGRFVTGGFLDTQCGLKGFRKQAVKELFAVTRVTGFTFDVELLYLALKRNFDIKRIPVVLECQEGTSVRVLRHGTEMLMDIAKILFRQFTGQYRKKDREEILGSFPKMRQELPEAYQKIYETHYHKNRGGNYKTTGLSRKLEAWMHRQVAADTGKFTKAATLEIGAGTLNQIPYEPAGGVYDIVEPFTGLFQSSEHLPRIRKVFTDVNEVNGARYQRITSIATFEHITNLPELVARTILLLNPAHGQLRIAIPNEGSMAWYLGTTITGREFKKLYKLDYQVLMRFEHVNTADEIERVLHYFFGDVRHKVFGISRKLALYRFYSCRQPYTIIARDYLKRIGEKP